jgi:hypothetical protein
MKNYSTIGICCFLCFVFAAMVYFTGCSRKSDIRSAESTTLDLMSKFETVNSSPSVTRFHRNFPVIRNGERRDTLTVVAPLTIRTYLHDVSTQMTLEGFVAPVFNIGDGIQMQICLKRGRRLRLVASGYFDPGRNAEDRKWVPIKIPLNPEEGDQLEIQVTPGPQGDSVADWLAFSCLRLATKQ